MFIVMMVEIDEGYKWGDGMMKMWGRGRKMRKVETRRGIGREH
jgi:hypothetical protein